MPDPQQVVEQSASDLSAWVSQFFANNFLTIVVTLGVALLIFIVGRWLARYLSRLFARWLERSSVDATASGYLAKLFYIALLIMVVIAALSFLGVPMTSFVAVLGASVLAIGLALQDSMSNLAAGLLVIILKPYNVGNVVQIGDQRMNGTVEEVSFFHTTLRTIDNSLLLVPNNDVMANPILNYTELEWRRVDLEFGIGYDDDLLLAKQVLTDIATGDPRVLEEPTPRIAVKELADNSVVLIMQPYVVPADYLSVKYDLTERVKLRFDEVGITIPYPQRTIYVVPPPGAESSTQVGA